MKNSYVDAHLKKLERELAERILLLCAFVGACFGNGNGGFGNRLLESIDNTDIDIHYDFERIDLSKYSIGRNLLFFYEYAYHARCTQGIDWDSWASDSEDGVFQEFLNLTGTYAIMSSGANIPEWWTEGDVYSGLRDMMNLCHARHRLDFEEAVSIADITLLTNMNEKSVRNALRDEGENKLQSFNGEHIESAEALRWMRGRKSGFRETTFIAFDKDELPENLRYIEIAPFIKERLEKFCDHSVGSFRYADAAERLGYSCEKIWSILDDIDNLPIKDTHRIAKVIKVDPVWFTEQVFTALFPEQMELILYKKEIEYEVDTNEQEKPYIEINLTEKGIKNGYIDIPAKFSEFFPPDCFGDRATGNQGIPIELRFGNEIRSTDMRVKSSITISPRARFGGYLNKVINAKPGDTLRITKVEDRVFEIKHTPI
ncbi:MAG: hypothetical protein Q8L79_02975 [Methylobacter sp.]|uniref:hypothetical protein n=1 Tax=Methylobacter sp. TaxID=2051955 RepID=UPI002730D106|nr:hypothetical protein [Methylobacter sp.]MDP1664063.1 hypothetical protein [Methylobacter sp.]